MSLVQTEAHTEGLNVAIGEVITYTVVVTLPEGTSNNVLLRDSLDSGLALGGCSSVTASPGLSTSIGVFADVCMDPVNPVVTSSGRVLAWNLGTVTNINTDNSVDEAVTFVYTAVVLNGYSNDRGDRRRNRARWEWRQDTATHTIEDRADRLTMVEPTLQIAKVADPTRG